MFLSSGPHDLPQQLRQCLPPSSIPINNLIHQLRHHPLPSRRYPSPASSPPVSSIALCRYSLIASSNPSITSLDDAPYDHSRRPLLVATSLVPSPSSPSPTSASNRRFRPQLHHQVCQYLSTAPPVSFLTCAGT